MTEAHEPEQGPRRTAGDPDPARSDRSTAPSVKEFWTWIEKTLLPLLAAAGAVLFGLLTIEYDQFYRELGMAPGDVGVDYSTQLSGSVGLAVMTLAASAAAFVLLQAVRSVGRQGDERSGQQDSRTQHSNPRHVRDRANQACSFLRRVRDSLWPRLRSRSLLVCCVAGVLLVAVYVWYKADETADEAKKGEWVQPLHIGPITYLSVRAYPADVRLAVEDSGKALDLGTVSRRHLLYIGHGPGTVVLYDHIQQRPVYLPAKDVIVTTYNCETSRGPQKSRCKD